MEVRMQFYMAPMEGLTGYIFRNAYQKHYGGIDRYFTPFITNRKLNHRELQDVVPEHNAGMDVVPQILTNRAKDFLCIAEELEKLGYRTVNLNLGCPSGTVVAKNRGAGFLALPDELDAFLEEIFRECPLGISIKTRIGKDSGEEWERLLAIYEKYPLEELIIHPRVQKDFYKNTVRLEAYGVAVDRSRHSLCYNGDICAKDDYGRLVSRFPGTEKIMIGRGLLKHPWLIGELRGRLPESTGSCEEFRGADKGMADARVAQQAKTHETAQKERFLAFHDDILHGYLAVMSGDKNTLFKMKELWVYFAESFTDSGKYMKKIRKSERIAEYEAHVAALFREQELK